MDKRFYLTEDEKRRILGLHQNSIKKNRINEVEVRDIQKQILALGGYVGQKEADNRLGPDTLNAIYNYLSKMNPVGPKMTEFKPESVGDGSDETFDPPVADPKAATASSTATTTSSTATTTPSTATTTDTSVAPTTPGTAPTTPGTAPTTPRTGREIRQDYRQGQRDLRQQGRQQRRDVRQAQRELADLQKRYRNLEGKMTAQDKTSYETRIKQLQDEIGQA